MSNKWWIDSEEGRLAIEEIRDRPEVLQVFTEFVHKYVHLRERDILTTSMLKVEKEREMTVKMSELSGAKDMVKSFIELLGKSR